MDIFRDPIWEGIAGVITIVGAILAVIVFISPTFRERLRVWLVNFIHSRFARLVFLGAFLFLLGIVVGIVMSPRDRDTELVFLPLYAQVAEVAWNALGEEEYLVALSLTEACITNFESQAVQLQRSLSMNREPPLAVGNVDDEDVRSRIFSNGVLNEVASCYYIQADAFKALNCTNEAREAYSKVLQFPHARVWDPTQNLFWSPTDLAAQSLAQLPESDQETLDSSCSYDQKP